MADITVVPVEYIELMDLTEGDIDTSEIEIESMSYDDLMAQYADMSRGR